MRSHEPPEESTGDALTFKPHNDNAAMGAELVDLAAHNDARDARAALESSECPADVIEELSALWVQTCRMARACCAGIARDPGRWHEISPHERAMFRDHIVRSMASLFRHDTGDDEGARAVSSALGIIGAHVLAGDLETAERARGR